MPRQLCVALDPQHRDMADLVVEVCSPISFVYDHTTKADTYGVLGVRELWLANEADQTVEVRYLEGNGFGVGKIFRKGEQIISTVFPTLNLPVEKLFED